MDSRELQKVEPNVVWKTLSYPNSLNCYGSHFWAKISCIRQKKVGSRKVGCVVPECWLALF